MNSVTLNGASSVTVAPGASITTAVSVTSGNGNGNRAGSIGWRIATTAPGPVTCFNITNHNGTTVVDTFSITTPTVMGTYNAYFIAYSDDECLQQPSNTVTLTNGVVVGKAAATITLTIPTGLTYTGAAQGVLASVSPNVEGLAVTYNDGTALPVNAGSYAVRATLTNANYDAEPKSGTLVIGQAGQSITFGALANKTYLDAPFTVSATGGSSGEPVTFAASGNCSVAGSTVTITGAGSCTITASQAGNDNYAAATAVSQSFTIAKAAATITLTIPTGLTYTGAAQAALALVSPNVGGLAVTYNGVLDLPVNAGRNLRSERRLRNRRRLDQLTERRLFAQLVR